MKKIREASERVRKAAVEAGRPAGAERQDTGEDAMRLDGGHRSAGRDQRNGGPAEAPDRGGFAAGVADEALVEILLDFENRVDTFGRDVQAAGVREKTRRVEPIVDGNVDLTAAPAVGVYDEGTRGAIALGQVARKEVEPVALGDRAAGRGVLEQLADGEMREHFALDVQEDAAQVDLAGAPMTPHGSRVRGGYAAGRGLAM